MPNGLIQIYEDGKLIEKIKLDILNIQLCAKLKK
jgi:hypothetical protein